MGETGKGKENKYVMTQRSFQIKVRYKNDQERQSKISELKITKKIKFFFFLFFVILSFDICDCLSWSLLYITFI